MAFSQNIQVTNFSSSWNNGLAFCALIHHFYPDAFDYSQLDPKNRRYNFNLAFDTAEYVLSCFVFVFYSLCYPPTLVPPAKTRTDLPTFKFLQPVAIWPDILVSGPTVAICPVTFILPAYCPQPYFP